MGNVCCAGDVEKRREMDPPKECEDHQWEKVDGAVREVKSRFGTTYF